MTLENFQSTLILGASRSRLCDSSAFLSYVKLRYPSPMRPDSLLRLWLYINNLLTYLLTYS